MKLCNADQLPSVGSMKSFVSRDGLQICVASFEQDETPTLTAFHNRCPHQNAPLSAGHLEGSNVVCPYHGWRFDTLSGKGECADDPGLEQYEIRRYGHEVFVRLPD